MKTLGVILVAALAILVQFWEVLQQDLQEYRAEGKCVAGYIAKGVERKDIKTFDGTCKVIRYGEPIIINPKGYSHGIN